MHNYAQLQGHAGTRVLAPVKGDAYGHGAVPVARALQAAGCAWLGVATVEEGLELRQAGIDLPILLHSGAGLTGADAAVAAELTCAVFSVPSLKRLDAAARRARRVVPVHLKVDTGMSRIGVLPEQVHDFLTVLATCDNLHLDGLMTHFARADVDVDAIATQRARFEAVREQILAAGHRPTFVHADNSAATLRDGPHYDLVRPGIALYGAEVGGDIDTSGLRPVMSLHSAVHFVHHVAAGVSVSYGGTWTATRPTRLAVIPIGYADGYLRALSNQASVLIAGQRAPLRGRVCMDLIIVDTTDIDAPVEEGTPVVLFGQQGDEQISAGELAGLAGTISYEVLAGLGARVPRVWVNA